MTFNETIRASAIRLGESLKGKPWFSSVGIAEEQGPPVLVVYARRGRVEDAPQSWDGVPVRLQYLGNVIPSEKTKTTNTVPDPDGPYVLRPCPFCGNADVLILTLDGAGVPYVECGKCWARGPAVIGFKWNQRVEFL